MTDPAPFDHPSALIAHLVARGFRSGTEGVSLPPSTYGHVMWPQDPSVLPCSAQILGSAGGPRLSVSFGAHYPIGEREALRRGIETLVLGLFTASGLEAPETPLTDAFAAHGERALSRGALSLDVVFPTPEPGQDFEHFALGVSRTLRPGEWEAWVEGGLFAAEQTAQDLAEATCRALLRRHGHPLAEAVLVHALGTDLGDERMDMFMVEAGGSIQLTTRPNGVTAMIVGADGTILDLD